MESSLAVMFMLGLPIWLAVEQIFMLMRSTQPTVLPVAEEVRRFRRLPERLN